MSCCLLLGRPTPTFQRAVPSLLLCLHGSWKLWPESLRAAPREETEWLQKSEPQPGSLETDEKKQALTCPSVQEKVLGSGLSVALAWVKRVSQLLSYLESLSREEKVRSSFSLPPVPSQQGFLSQTHQISSAKSQVQQQPGKEATVVLPAFTGGRKSSQGFPQGQL